MASALHDIHDRDSQGIHLPIPFPPPPSFHRSSIQGEDQPLPRGSSRGGSWDLTSASPRHSLAPCSAQGQASWGPQPRLALHYQVLMAPKELNESVSLPTPEEGRGAWVGGDRDLGNTKQ